MSNSTLSPQYISSMFGGSLPQIQASGVNGAQAAGGSQIDASQYGSDAMTQQIMSALQPQYAQQQRALTDNLANAGIVGGSTAGAVADLANQQNTQTLGQLAPIQQQANAQQLGAQEFNSSQSQANNQYNAGNALAAQQYNATAANTANTGNVQNSLATATNDSNTFNTLLQQILGYQNEGYLQNQQDQYGLATGAAGGQQQAFTPIYQQPGQGILGGLAGIAGQFAGSGGGASGAGGASAEDAAAYAAI